MVGIFAGRGDVLVAMGLALVIGIWLGWQLRGGAIAFRQRFPKKPPNVPE